MNVLQRSKTELFTSERRAEHLVQPQATRVTRSLELYKKFDTGNHELEQLCCRFDPEDTLVAAGNSHGSISIFPVGSILERPITIEPLSGEDTGLPIACLRWRPNSGLNANNHVLVSACTDGSISYWHGLTGKLLHSTKEKNNQVYCLDYNHDGSLLASGGLDKTIRVYDENSKTVISSLATAVWRHPGHSNRILSVKFDPKNPNMIVSGGWDRTVYFWDLRAGKSVGSINGPAIHGDSLDIKGDQLLTGSWRPKEQVEIWNIGTKKKVSTLTWDKGYNSDNNLVLTCQFSKKNNDSIIAGCSGRAEVKIFERNEEFNCFGSILGPKKGVFCVDYAHKSDLVAYCGGDGTIQLASIHEKYAGRGSVKKESNSLMG
jgi:WD40 repeat protein